jgi:hypothetical protein
LLLKVVAEVVVPQVAPTVNLVVKAVKAVNMVAEEAVEFIIIMATMATNFFVAEKAAMVQ